MEETYNSDDFFQHSSLSSDEIEKYVSRVHLYKSVPGAVSRWGREQMKNRSKVYVSGSFTWQDIGSPDLKRRF